MQDRPKNSTRLHTALWLAALLSPLATPSYAAPMSDYGDAPTTDGFNYGDAYHGDSPILETLTITGSMTTGSRSIFRKNFTALL